VVQHIVEGLQSLFKFRLNDDLVVVCVYVPFEVIYEIDDVIGDLVVDIMIIDAAFCFLLKQEPIVRLTIAFFITKLVRTTNESITLSSVDGLMDG
jgi:hypothetical protein